MIGVLGGSVYIQDNQIKQRSHLDQSATGEERMLCIIQPGLVSCNILVGSISEQ